MKLLDRITRLERRSPAAAPAQDISLEDYVALMVRLEEGLSDPPLSPEEREAVKERARRMWPLRHLTGMEAVALRLEIET